MGNEASGPVSGPATRSRGLSGLIVVYSQPEKDGCGEGQTEIVAMTVRRGGVGERASERNRYDKLLESLGMSSLLSKHQGIV